MPVFWLQGSIRNLTFYDNYKIEEKPIGKGVISRVYKCVCNSTDKQCAVRIIYKQGKEQQTRDVEDLYGMKHDNILRIKEIYETQTDIHVVRELATGPKMFEWLASHDQYSEYEVAVCMRDILSAVQYLHEHDIVHGNLKPENIFLKDNPEEKIQVQIGDYSKYMIDGDESCRLVNVFCAVDFTAPEILLGKPYDKPVDLWSIGVIAYTLLSGFLPFNTDFEVETYKRVLHCKPMYDQNYWNEMTENAKDLVQHLLVLDVQSRMTAKQALRHLWLNGAALKHRILPTAANSLKYVNSKRALKVWLETPKVIQACDLANSFPVSKTRRAELYDSTSSSDLYSLGSDESLARLVAGLAAATPNSTTRALLAELNANDRLSRLQRHDMSEGQVLGKSSDTDQGPVLDGGKTSPLYKLAMIEPDIPPCNVVPCEDDRASPLPGNGLVFDEQLPWVAPQDLGADFGEIVGEDGNLFEDVFDESVMDDEAVIKPVITDWEESHLSLVVDLNINEDQLNELLFTSQHDHPPPVASQH